MRTVLLTAVFLGVSLGAPKVDLSGTDANPYVKLTQVVKDGTLRITAKNISKKPIVAYVVAVADGGAAMTHHDYYTGRDSFAPGKTIELVFALRSASSTPKAFVDYVRLSDKSTAGSAVTDDGRDVAASFGK